VIFKSNKNIETFGQIAGYIFAYFLFTSILFFLLSIVHKIPSSWNYFNIMAVTFAVALAGIIIKRLLK